MPDQINVNVNNPWHLDPEKTKAFVKGFNEGDPEAGKHTAIIGGAIVVGAVVGGLMTGGAGAVVGGALGMTAATAYLAYDKMTHEKGYHGEK